MENEVLPELKNFIIAFCEEFKVRKADFENISLDTSLDVDLSITGDDMAIFMDDFAEAFAIDMTDFQWGKKFKYPSDDNFSTVYEVFRYVLNYQNKWVRNFCHRMYPPGIFVRDLQDAIQAGKFACE